MEEKDFFEVEELDKDIANIKENMALLGEYSELLRKVRDLRKKEK